MTAVATCGAMLVSCNDATPSLVCRDCRRCDKLMLGWNAIGRKVVADIVW